MLFSFVVSAQVQEKDTAETREQKVRDLLEKFSEAYQQKNVDALEQYVAPDLTGFAAGKTFSSWQQYRDTVLARMFARQMPPSTWQIEKIVTSPEMAWAYTKTSYKGRRQGQPIEADLYQVFVIQKLAGPAATKNKSALPATDWKIALIDYTLHAEPMGQHQESGAQGEGAQPQTSQPRL